MYKVLIAEDKPLIRRGIISMIHWDELGCIFCGEAENGREALKMIDTLSPDIVLTDIKMPLVDGLRVLDYIAEQKLPIESIIISGYDRFEYATHALRSNCVDYILKPIREEQLNTAIERACARLHQRAEDLQHTDDALLHFSLYSKLKQDESLTGAELCDAIHYTLHESRYCTACFSNKYGRFEELAAWLQENPPLRYPPLCFYDQSELTALFPCKDEGSFRSLCEFLARLPTLVPGSLAGDLAAGVSVQGAFSAPAQPLYQQAHHMLNYQALHPQQTIFLAGSLKAQILPAQSVSAHEKDLLDYLMSGNASAAVHMFEQIVEEHLHREDVTPESFTLLLTQCYCILLKTNAACAQDIQQEINRINRPDILLGHTEVQFLCQPFCHFCRRIAAEAVELHNSHHALVQGIQQYLEEHFNEHITLKTLESIFHVNASYLSVLFKQESGIGFNQYLKELRLNRAKTLVAQTEYPLAEVCERSGFSNYIHFSKMFKEYTGKSPSEFRKGAAK